MWHVSVTVWSPVSISVCSLSDASRLSRFQIGDSELLHWKELVAKCMTEYCSSECNKPDNKKLVWIVSRRTAQNLQANHFSVPGLPTIHEGIWDERERLIDQFFHFLHAEFYMIWINRVLMRYWENCHSWMHFVSPQIHDSAKSQLRTVFGNTMFYFRVEDPWMVKWLL